MKHMILGYEKGEKDLVAKRDLLADNDHQVLRVKKRLVFKWSVF